MKYGIKCYTSDEVQERIETIYGEKTVGMNRMHVTNIGSFQVIPFQSPHNGTECDGFLIKHEKIGFLLFITDSEYCKTNYNLFRLLRFLQRQFLRIFFPLIFP